MRRPRLLRQAGSSRVPGRAVLLALVLAVGAGVVTYLVTAPDTSPAHATREAWAAVAVDVLDIDPSSYVPDPDRGVRVNWHPGGDPDAHALYLDVAPRDGGTAPPCDGSCATWEVDGGEITLVWEDAHVESDPGLFQLTFATQDELRMLAYQGAEIHGDPRESDDLPIPVSRLAAVVTDERFGGTTTREMASVELKGWPRGWEDADDPAATTSKLVAHWVEELGVRPAAGAEEGDPPTVTPYSPAAYGQDAVGAHVQLDGWSISAVIVPTESAPRCGPRWHCTTRPHFYVDRDWQVTTGWRRGQALVVNHLDGRDVVAEVTSSTISRFPRPVRHGGPVRTAVGEAVQAFERAVGARWRLSTTQGVLAAYEDLEPFAP